MLALSEPDACTTRVRSVLEEMPDRVYRGLPNPLQTAEICLATVERALTQHNPRAIWDWIDYERATPDVGLLIECFDLSVNSVLGKTTDRELIQFGEQLRRETRDYVGFHARRTRREALTRDIEPIVDGILVAVHAFDPKLYEHSLVVARFAERIANAMELTSESCAAIVMAGRVHEVGKLRVSRRLYNKPLPLTRAELNAVHEQIRSGQAMLRNHPLLAGIAAIVEGSNEIEAGGKCPEIESRILAVADVFHTLMQARPYRKAFAPHEALQTLQEMSDRFDSRIVAKVAMMLGQSEDSVRSA